MKFFVVILAVIGIQSIGNTAGQSPDTEITVNVNSLKDFGNKILTAYHTHEGNQVKFLKDVKPGDLTFYMELSVDSEVVMEAKESDPHDFCEDSVAGEVLRGALAPQGQTSCPINKGDYSIRMPYDVLVSDPQKLKQMKCGEYTGVVDISQGPVNTFMEMEFDFELDADLHKCQQ